MTPNKPTVRQRWSKFKLTKTTAFWLAIGAIVITLIFGFTRGGWTTGGSAQTMSDRASDTAVVERLGMICVGQFNQDPQRDEKLVELKALNSTYQRNTFVTEAGWATMPGDDAAERRVAEDCAQRLMQLDE